MRVAAGDRVLLIRSTFDGSDAALAARLGPVAARLDGCRALEGGEICLYAAAQAGIATAAGPLVAGALAAPVEETVLTCARRLPGASAGADARFHYVVETDVLAEREADFNAWYEEEHLPGLASVPGTVSAMRFVRDGDGGPRYYACYDLATLETFGSPAWLAVRATAWSSRVRPAFRNTRRTMYRRITVG